MKKEKTTAQIHAHKKLSGKIISLLLSLTLVLTMAVQATATNNDLFIIGSLIGNYEYYILKDGTVSIIDYAGNESNLVIPDEIDGKKVTEINQEAFYNCISLKSVTIPPGVTSIGLQAFAWCPNLTKVVLPNDLLYIGAAAFAYCKNLKDLTIPDSVSEIGNSAFIGCASLEEMTIPSGVTEMAVTTFHCCTSLKRVTILDGVTSINSLAFSGCSNLERVILPESLTHIGEQAFYGCINLKEITVPKSVDSIELYALGYCLDDNTGEIVKIDDFTIKGYSDTEAEKYAKNNNFKFINLEITNGLRIYSDHTNLSIKKNDVITIGAGVFVDDRKVSDISKLTFSLYDKSIIDVDDVSVHDNCRFVKLKGINAGTTYITFSDSNTGYVTRVPITVCDTELTAYTLGNVPKENIEKYETNFYNANGLYIDSFKYMVNYDKTVSVSFDVYNTNHSYGLIEIYNKDGSMYNAVIIDKMTNNASSIKESVWDNLCFVIRDLRDGDFFTYRQESGYSKKTSIEQITIPEGGYFKITTDISESFLLGFINGVDIMLGLKSIEGDIKEFDIKSRELADKITKKLLKDEIYAQILKNQGELEKKLLKNIVKDDIVFSTKAVGDFSENFLNNINELHLDKILIEAAAEIGWNIGEDIFEYFSGAIGQALKGVFTIGDLADLIIERNNIYSGMRYGSIVIQNQSGGVRAASQVTVKSDTNFDNDTALKVFRVQPDDIKLNALKESNPEFYEKVISETSITYNISMIKNGIEEQIKNEVEVSIPIPERFYLFAAMGLLKVYRVEENGSVTEMNSKFRDGCLVFKTNHFSIYSIINDNKMLLGDANNDGTVDAKDRMFITRHIAKWQGYESINEAAADVNADGLVDAKDRMVLTRHIAKWVGYEKLPYNKMN